LIPIILCMDASCWWSKFCFSSVFRDKEINLSNREHAKKVADYIQETATESMIGYWHLNVKFPIDPSRHAIEGLIHREQRERGFPQCLNC